MKLSFRVVALAVAAARFHAEGPFEVHARTSHAEFENASVSSDEWH